MSTAEISAQKQLMLELINRARLDPLGEAALYGIDLNQGLTAGTIPSAPKEPLAFNTYLRSLRRTPPVGSGSSPSGSPVDYPPRARTAHRRHEAPRGIRPTGPMNSHEFVSH